MAAAGQGMSGRTAAPRRTALASQPASRPANNNSRAARHPHCRSAPVVAVTVARCWSCGSKARYTPMTFSRPAAAVGGQEPLSMAGQDRNAAPQGGTLEPAHAGLRGVKGSWRGGGSPWQRRTPTNVEGVAADERALALGHGAGGVAEHKRGLPLNEQHQCGLRRGRRQDHLPRLEPPPLRVLQRLRGAGAGRAGRSRGAVLSV